MRRVAQLLMIAVLAQGAAIAARDDGLGSVPQQMRAAAIDHGGDADALTPHTLPVPKPAPNEVLIALSAAGVGGWDVEIRQRPERIKNSHLPLILGTDGAGRIAAIGAHVHGFKVGEAVYSYSWDNPQGGFYAEYVAVPAERVGPVPGGLTLTQAGAIGTTALTAIQGIDDALHTARGQSVVVHGGAGGVGTLAVQFAKWRGARVLATVSSADEVDFVKGLGADVVVDGRHSDITAAARDFAPAGVDAVLALAGGDALERCIDALKSDGTVAYPYGVQPPKARPGIRVVGYDAVAGPAQFKRLNMAIEAIKLQVPIAAQFPLNAAADAQRRVEASHVLGKVVILIH